MAEYKRKQYTPEFKAKVVLESLQRDTTIEEVRKKYGVSNSMIQSESQSPGPRICARRIA